MAEIRLHLEELTVSTDAGTPQGGIISPTITNLTLDGMETTLRQHFGARGSERARKNKVNLVRYADGTPVQA